MDWAERLDKQMRDYLSDVSVLKEEPKIGRAHV